MDFNKLAEEVVIKGSHGWSNRFRRWFEFPMVVLSRYMDVRFVDLPTVSHDVDDLHHCLI